MSKQVKVGDVLTLAEAARYLRLTQEAVKKHAQRGDIPGRLIGKQWRFLKAALDCWLAQSNSKTAFLQQFGALADDPYLPELRKAIYAARGRPETAEEAAD